VSLTEINTHAAAFKAEVALAVIKGEKRHDLLRGEGVDIGREMVRTMMRWMGIEASYCCPNTSKPCPGHKIYPYLLRGLAVERKTINSAALPARQPSRSEDLSIRATPDRTSLSLSGSRAPCRRSPPTAA
jgi:hypothetical protein